MKGFNFLVNSFWAEVEEKIEQYIKSIFAPGDPVLFHKVSKANNLEIYKNTFKIDILKIYKKRYILKMIKKCLQKFQVFAKILEIYSYIGIFDKIGSRVYYI